MPKEPLPGRTQSSPGYHSSGATPAAMRPVGPRGKTRPCARSKWHGPPGCAPECDGRRCAPNGTTCADRVIYGPEGLVIFDHPYPCRLGACQASRPRSDAAAQNMEFEFGAPFAGRALGWGSRHRA